MASDPIRIDELVGDVTFILLNHSGYDENTDRQIRRALDAELQCLVAETQFTAFKKYDTFSTDAGKHTYAMPDDFVQCLAYGLQYTASPFTPLVETSEREWLESGGERHTTSGDPNCFWGTNKDEHTGLWQFRIHPTPQSAISITRVYLSMPHSIAGTVYGGDHVLDPRFPTQHAKKGLVAAAALHLGQYIDEGKKQDLRIQVAQTVKDLSNKSEPVIGNLRQKRLYGGGYGRGMGLPTVNILSIR